MIKTLLKEGPKVVNIGVEQFYLDVKTQKAEASSGTGSHPQRAGTCSPLKKLSRRPRTFASE